MNSNSKKSGFSKKSIIVGVLVFAIIIISLLLFNVLSKGKQEIVNCYYETSRHSVYQKVKYIDGNFADLELEQRINFSNIELKISLEEIKESLISNFEEHFSTLNSDAEYFVRIDEETMIFGYKLNSEDYKKLEDYLKGTNEISTSIDNFYEDKNRFIQQVISQGGECIYE